MIGYARSIGIRKTPQRGILMKGILNLVLMTLLVLSSPAALATEPQNHTLSELMATLEASYARYYDRQGKPIGVPASIKNQYQSLIDEPKGSEGERARFISEIQQNIADFRATEDVRSSNDEAYDRLENAFRRLRLSPQMPENIQLINNSFMDVVEDENFTGKDILNLEQRYQVAIEDYSQDVFQVIEQVFELDSTAENLSRNAFDFTPSEIEKLNRANAQFFAALDEIKELVKQQAWAAAKRKIPQATLLGEEAKDTIALISQQRERDSHRYTERLTALSNELNQLESEINELEDRIHPYQVELREPCDEVRVDLSCAQRCPQKMERDMIFGTYKYKPDYQCLSRCNNAERESQAEYDYELAVCEDEKDRIYDKAVSLNEKLKRLVDRYNRRLREYKAVAKESAST